MPQNENENKELTDKFKKLMKELLVSEGSERQRVSSEIKGFIKNCLLEVKSVSKSDVKKKLGKVINNFKEEFDESIKELRKNETQDGKSDFDPTIFKQSIKLGASHPLINLYKIIEKIFINMGFNTVQGPEIELDRYNFEKLNMPQHHPARDMQDTFYVRQPSVLLRSHTSSVQIRTMESQSAPVQIISPGTVYRVDDIDPQHTPMFFQIEGLMMGEGISFANLKAILIKLLKEVFGYETEVRFRPSYYPYTEPSAAVDMSCIKCGKRGCPVCAGSGWITILGSGMVHPKVVEGVGYDSENVIGFAFGIGLDRLALLYYDLGEIKKLYENDVSLWRQLC
ncbi:MAG: phenylalanine--tRNA ligase subunit alpha [Oscillospiraceae bacterium]|jgi:phenylalanyl-tRNA synthetase alpha chain|nr:phenylalanine--tRNA ligase subunit alpha [Oscillospiraceae bacterium]